MQNSHAVRCRTMAHRVGSGVKEPKVCESITNDLWRATAMNGSVRNPVSLPFDFGPRQLNSLMEILFCDAAYSKITDYCSDGTQLTN